MTAPSVQLYSVREAIDEDLDAAVERLAKIGFTKVEPYAFHLRVDDYMRAFAAAGVTAPTGHASVVDSAQPETIFDAAAEMGVKLVIDPYIPTDRWQTLEDVAWLADRVNTLSKLAGARGLRFGYHNHQWEFTNRVHGRVIFDAFVERLAPEVRLEVDAFWATVGGADTPAVLRALGDRVQAVHIKDGRISGDITTVLPSTGDTPVVPDALAAAFANQTPAGQGDVDVKGVLAAAPHALRVVEFDAYNGDIFAGIAESYAWLQQNDLEVTE